ncbi:LAMI_0G10462g1_1 [Lachancea mirantina]|uniref:Heat shock transcription factor n=1 Tax=Lachancea mirantina TaxID=1230905 RepID=A0A1G4KAN4_9SACH|nr:LAMI_0G10462g1_1 [Lachancea mirantina]
MSKYSNQKDPSALNIKDLENIIEPDDSTAPVIDANSQHPGLATVNDANSVIEDIVNPSLDPAMMMPQPRTASQEITQFSPSIPVASLAPHDQNIVRRGTPVGIYQPQGSPSAGQAQLHENLLSDTLLMPYRTRFLQNPNHRPSPPPNKRKLTATKTRPAFINKLWSMVNDTTNQKLIKWSDDGKSFIVTNREKFVHEILPKYFKHSNFASFVRQLNMYGWHKVQDVRSGSIQGSSDERWQFKNDHFVRGREEMLDEIVRQKPSSNSNNNNNSKDSFGTQTNEDMDIGIMLNELETVKFNQMAIAEDLKRMSKDNEMLWKENMLARERHQAQQQALNKILHLLASLLGSNTTKLLGGDLINELTRTNSNMENQAAAHPWDPTHAAPIARPRLLLKNRTTPVPTSPDEGSIYHTNSRNASASTMPQTAGISPIQELDRWSIHQPSTASEATSPGFGSSRISEVPFEPQSPAVDTTFLNDLQTNIKHQGESIQELQDWISRISPDEDPHGGAHHSEPEQHAASHVTMLPDSSTMGSGPGSGSGHGTASVYEDTAASTQPAHAKFDLQDYLSTPANTALTPLLQEESPAGSPAQMDDNPKSRKRSDAEIQELPNPTKKQHL